MKHETSFTRKNIIAWLALSDLGGHWIRHANMPLAFRTSSAGTHRRTNKRSVSKYTLLPSCIAHISLHIGHSSTMRDLIPLEVLIFARENIVSAKESGKTPPGNSSPHTPSSIQRRNLPIKCYLSSQNRLVFRVGNWR